MSEHAQNRVCPMCRARTASLHCERDGTGTFKVDNIDVLGASRLRPGDLVAHRYRVVRRIGRGGMGAVYEAEHTGSGQRVAVKVLALEPGESGDAEVFFRFYREARITASLKHANTVRLFDFGQSDSGALFMAMELLHGPTLQQLVARRGAQGAALTAQETVSIALPILRSLREAHQAGLVHRDLKPDNVMLAEQGDEDIVVKVLDFGIARGGDSHLTNISHLIGTPAYMSPEQCLGTPLDGRSDLYALGVLMYFCLTGVTPFRGDAVAQIRGHCDGTPPKLDSLARTPLPQGLVAAVERAMAKAPDDRFADAREMREALEQSVVERLSVTRAWIALPPGEVAEELADPSSADIENAPTMAAATPVTGRPDAGWGAGHPLLPATQARGARVHRGRVQSARLHSARLHSARVSSVRIHGGRAGVASCCGAGIRHWVRPSGQHGRGLENPCHDHRSRERASRRCKSLGARRGEPRTSLSLAILRSGTRRGRRGSGADLGGGAPTGQPSRLISHSASFGTSQSTGCCWRGYRPRPAHRGYGCGCAAATPAREQPTGRSRRRQRGAAAESAARGHCGDPIG